MAIDRDGNAMAVWVQGGVVRVATRPAAGGVVNDGWTAGPDPLLPNNAGSAKVVFDGQGTALVISNVENASSARIYVATLPRGGSDWTREVIAGTGGTGVFYPDVAVNARGDAVALWLRTTTFGTPPASNAVPQVATRPAGASSWSSPYDLVKTAPDYYGAPSSRPHVAIDEQGNAVAVWSTTHDNRYLGEYTEQTKNLVQAAVRPHDASPSGWSDPHDLSVPGQYGSAPDVAYGGQGDAVAVWLRHSGYAGVVQSATLSREGVWSERRDLSDPLVNPDAPGANTPAVVVDGAGNALATWAFNPLVDPKMNCNFVPCIPCPAGNATGNCTIQAAGYDAAGPQLRDLQVPSEGTVGSPLSFSVAPVDVWSSVASTGWDFGDVAKADGTSVSHTYAAPGSYPVTVTSTDSLGNSSTENRTVTVAAPGSAGSGGAGPILTVPGGGGPPIGALPPAGTGDSAALAAALARERLRARALAACLSPVARHRRRETLLARSGSARARRLASRHARSHTRVLRGRCLRRHGRTPGQVTGLSASALARKELILSFRAPGSDRASLPPARSYLVKQSTSPITDLRGFRAAQSLCNGACRFPLTRVGEQVKLRITDLRPRTTYYYAIAARDNVSRRLGPRSQTVKAKTG